jgi:surfeit locus 1 family protein
VALNWLNIFYAVEWVIFAGFAIFLWYRLARDAWERELEELEELEQTPRAELAPERAIH